MKTPTPHAQCAKEIRKYLKSIGVKAKVKSSSFSMGNSVDVTFENIPYKRYQEISAKLNDWQYGHFDGMQDMYEYSNSRDDLTQVKYVQTSINYSDELKDKAWNWYRALNHNDNSLPTNRKDIPWSENYGLVEPGNDCGHVYRGETILRAILSSDYFWDGYKPRIRMTAA